MTRPDYIARGGDLVMAQPLALQDATMYSFLARADLAALTRLCDTHLNAVTGGRVVYKPLLPMVSIVCADITKSFSTTPPDSQKGWMAERDFGIWVPVIAGTMDGSTWKPGRIGWYLPYVFVDNVAAMVTGREVFGFFKQTAALGMPASPSQQGDFSIDALAIQSYSPQSQATTVRLLTMTSTTNVAAQASVWTEARDALEAIYDDVKTAFFDGASDLPVTAWDLLKNMLADLITRDVPMVFLKQFRDASDPTKACYRAVIEAPARLDRWRGGGFAHAHDVAILPCDSHPIVRDCGLPGPQFRSELGFWCRMDFTMQAGKVIAE